MRLPETWRFDALGTSWSIESDEKIMPKQRQEITTFLDGYEEEFSRFRATSKVFQISQSAGRYTFEKKYQPNKLFEFYEQLYDITSGALTPLIGDTLRSVGYDENYSLNTDGMVAHAKDYNEVITREQSSLLVKHPVMIDVGAAGKGHAVDLVSSIMKSYEINQFVIDASGDIRVVNVPQTIGLEDPGDSKNIIGTITIDNGALCGSATNRRVWGDLHHIYDARTSQPTRQYVATWVLADTARIADGCATALFFLEQPDKLLSTYDITYIRIDHRGIVDTNTTAEKGVTLFL